MVPPDAAAATQQPAQPLAPAAMVAAAEAERIKLLAAHAGMPAGAFFHPSLMMSMYGPAGFAAAMAGAPGHMGAMTAEAGGMMLPWAAMTPAAAAQRTPTDAATQAACAASAAIAAAANGGWGGGVPFWAMDPAAAAAWAASAAAYGSYGAAAPPPPAGDAAASGRPPVPAGVSRPKAMPASAQLAGSTLNALGGMATGFAPPAQQQQQQQQQVPEAGMVPAGLVIPIPVAPTMLANPTALLRSLELQRHYGTSPAFAKPGVATIAAPGGAGFKRPREDVAPAVEQMHAEPIAAAAQ